MFVFVSTRPFLSTPPESSDIRPGRELGLLFETLHCWSWKSGEHCVRPMVSRPGCGKDNVCIKKDVLKTTPIIEQRRTPFFSHFPC